jgi:serine/threonine protein kinase
LLIAAIGYGKEVDWWALGIVCFELLTGWPPFFDRDFGRMCEKILSRQLKFPSKYHISADAQSLIKQLLNRDATQRLGCGRKGNSRRGRCGGTYLSYCVA